MPVWMSSLLNWAGLAAFISSLVALYVAWQRTPMQNASDSANAAKDRADTVSILQGLVDEKAREIDERSKSYISEIASLRSDLAEVKRIQQIPFRVTLEGLTYPTPIILRSVIETLPDHPIAIRKG